MGARLSEEERKERKRERNRKWAAANRDKMREFRRKWSAAHPELDRAAKQKWSTEHSEMHRAATRKWRAEHPDKVVELSRKYKYHLEPEHYQRLLAECRGRCAICGNGAKLCVDHDHATGVVRGLLCKGCNYALGNVRDNPDTLRKAAAYLERTHGTV